MNSRPSAHTLCLTVSICLALSGGSSLLAQDDKKAAAAPKTTFVDHVLPILENRCLNCHNPDEAKGGLDLSTFGATMTGGSGGEVVVAEDPGGSRLYTLMAHTETPKMPPEKPKSPDKEIEIIKNWIAGGLLETASSKARKSNKPKLDMNLLTTTGKPDVAAMPEHLILEPEVVTDRPNAVPALAHSPWAPIVAIAGQKQVLLYHSEDFDLLGVLPYPEGFPQSLNFSPNGSLLACGGGRGGKSGGVVVWDVKNGERVIEVGKEFDIVLGSDISADHRRVVMGGPGKNIKIWDTVTGEQVSMIKKHPDWMLTADISPDGVLFATGGRNSGLYVWETGSGLEFYTLKGHTKAVTDLAWRPDGNVMASVSEDGQAIIWEMNEGKQVKKWAAHGGGALAIDFSPDGQFIATAGRDKTVKIWKSDGTAVRTIAASPDIVMSVAFTHDSKRVISGDYTGEIKVWNVADGVELAKLDANPPSIDQQIAYSTKRIAEVRGQLPKLEEGIKVVSTELTNARNKLNEVNKAAADAAGKKAAMENLVKMLEGQAKTFTGQIAAAKTVLTQKQADAKTKTDAYNNQVKAQAAAKAEVTKWTAEFQKADAAAKQAAANLAAAKAEAEKPLLDANSQKALNDAAAKVAAADAAKKQSDAKVAQLKAADDAANVKLAAAAKAKTDAAAKLATAPEPEKPAAQNALNAATQAYQVAQNAKNGTAKALADARAVQ
ncbi:MAG: hypothetical protein HKN23_15540, partial [Verrucomicrobiales bacterium]|nr:hypothetical protein [Verrucomicrobiales bacterium]